MIQTQLVLRKKTVLIMRVHTVVSVSTVTVEILGPVLWLPVLGMISTEPDQTVSIWMNAQFQGKREFRSLKFCYIWNRAKSFSTKYLPIISEIAQNLAPLVPTLTVLTLVSATMVSQLSLSEDALSDVPMLTNAKLI